MIPPIDNQEFQDTPKPSTRKTFLTEAEDSKDAIALSSNVSRVYSATQMLAIS